MKENQIDIFFISDTQIFKRPCIRGYDYTTATDSIMSTNDSRPVRGMGIFHRVSVKILSAMKYNVWFTVKDPETLRELLVHGCYWPVAGHETQLDAAREYTEYLDGLDRRMFKLILSGGDFNSRTGSYGDPTMNAEGWRLLDIISSRALQQVEEINQPIGGCTRRQVLHW
eukprot:CAMPEP_0114497758 /NCGR_PEP_ID=MMETSP0109-20121206/6504_1 /TAXON_ID=29199 /ORGANISM="Chlorarachnion reptans, Strain CCCM449" /LENGTH=169 /DNA_ID=CAMNT_0001675179 /DNA_START=93 /DNA_END=599 /DNA_ORIENTATION=+